MKNKLHRQKQIHNVWQFVPLIIFIILFSALSTGICLQLFYKSDMRVNDLPYKYNTIENSPLSFIFDEGGNEASSSTVIPIIGGGDEGGETPTPPTTYYTVTYDSMGGNYIAPEKVAAGSSASAPTPTQKGFTFLGWYKSDGTLYADEAITSNITLTAHWEIQMFNVVFFADSEVYFQLQVEYGAILSTVIQRNIPQNYDLLYASSDNILYHWDSAIKDNCSIFIKRKEHTNFNGMTIAILIIASVVTFIIIVFIASLIIIRKRKKAVSMQQKHY